MTITAPTAEEVEGVEPPAFIQNDKSAQPAPAKPVVPELPEFLFDDWDVETPQITPTICPVEGGHALFYLGESHAISGPGGGGKTWVAADTIGKLVASDPTAVAVFIDYEGNRASFIERLKALGVEKDHAKRIAYWSIGSSLLECSPTGRKWRMWVEEFSPSFAVIDSVSKACAAAGLNDEFNEYQIWDNEVIMWLTARGITTLRIDHTGHRSAGSSGGSRARGSSTKDQAVSGASYLFEVQEHWTRQNNGQATLRCVKDRFGHHRSGAIAAKIAVSVEDDGKKLTITFTAPTAEEEIAQTPAPSVPKLTAGARSVKALTALGTWATKKEVQQWDFDNRPLTLDGTPASPLKADTCAKEMDRLATNGEIQKIGNPTGTKYAILGLAAPCDEALDPEATF